MQTVFPNPSRNINEPQNIQSLTKFEIDLRNKIANEIKRCLVSDDLINAVLEQIQKGNEQSILSLPECYSHDRKLMLLATLMNNYHFRFASEELKSDPIFIRRVLKFYPDALKFSSEKIRSDKKFMEQAIYINRNALEYATLKLRDNKLFMKRMVDIDSKNYIFASERIKKFEEIAIDAFEDDGMLISFAPEEIRSNKKLVTIAVKSNGQALKYAAKEFQEDKEFQILAESDIKEVNQEELKNYIVKNYIVKSDKKNLGSIIVNKAKNFPDNQLIDKKYIIKWRRNLDYAHRNIEENIHPIAAASRNFPENWKEDFKIVEEVLEIDLSEVISKVEKFFLKRYIDQKTVDSMKTTYFWEVSTNPKTYAFNIYLLRDSNEIDFDHQFVNVNSMTAIVKKKNDKWNLSVIEVIIDKEVKTEVAYQDGHKKYILWDLYVPNEQDNRPILIFKIEDRFEEYFEVFQERSNGKYKMIYRFNPLKEIYHLKTIDIPKLNPNQLK
jgi:hypothetical protein